MSTTTKKVLIWLSGILVGAALVFGLGMWTSHILRNQYCHMLITSDNYTATRVYKNGILVSTRDSKIENSSNKRQTSNDIPGTDPGTIFKDNNAAIEAAEKYAKEKGAELQISFFG